MQSGQIFTICTGDFDEYGVFAILRAKKDFNIESINKWFLESDTGKEVLKTFFRIEITFVHWLCENGFAERIEEHGFDICTSYINKTFKLMDEF